MRTLLVFILIFLCLSVYADIFPQRIVSLAPAITEELYLLGIEDRIVGVTTYCTKPEEAKTKEKVGTVIKMNIEKVVSLHPDLVLSKPLMDKAQIEKLKSLGIKVVSSPQPSDFSGICKGFIQLGRLVGKEKKAKEIIARASKRVEIISGKVKDLPKVRVFNQVGAKPLFTETKGTFIHDYITKAGGVNIAAESGNGLYSREEVLRQNPDVIIIVTMGIVGEQEKEVWRKFKTLNAVKNNRIYIVDSYKVCSPTPLSFAVMLEEIAGLLHPEICT